ncbi:hypothetical protein BASA81_007377 [Batrachochytrium salamandrivorans]|nr:hypothetical protein BASA81_007377 [Batrachochytrium salamandrivorans]
MKKTLLVLVAMLGLVQADVKSGIYYIDSCLENAPCCLDGFIAVAEDGYLTFNLAGFSEFCGSDLRKGFDERVGYFKPQPDDPTLLKEEVEIPHPDSGTQYMELSIRNNSGAILFRNVGAVRVISSGSATWVVSLEEGLKDGLSRDPAMRVVDLPDDFDYEGAKPSGLPAAAAAFVAVLCTCVAYFVMGVVYTKRGTEGKWDGEWKHVHSDQWHDVYAITAAKLSQAKHAIQQYRGNGGSQEPENNNPAGRNQVVLPIVSNKLAAPMPGSPTSGRRMSAPAVGGDFGTPSKARRPSKASWFGTRAPLFFQSSTGTASGAVTDEIIVATAVLSPPAAVNNRRNSLSHRINDDHQWV